MPFPFWCGLIDIIRGVVPPLLWSCRRLCLFTFTTLDWMILFEELRRLALSLPEALPFPFWCGLSDIIRGVVSPLLWANRRLCLFIFTAMDGMILFEEWWRLCFEPAGGYAFFFFDADWLRSKDVIDESCRTKFFCFSLEADIVLFVAKQWILMPA